MVFSDPLEEKLVLRSVAQARQRRSLLPAERIIVRYTEIPVGSYSGQASLFLTRNGRARVQPCLANVAQNHCQQLAFE